VSGYLCVCQCCGHEERTVPNPLKDGWPEHCGAGMLLVDTARFGRDVDQLMDDVFSPIALLRQKLGDE